MTSSNSFKKSAGKMASVGNEVDMQREKDCRLNPQANTLLEERKPQSLSAQNANQTKQVNDSTCLPNFQKDFFNLCQSSRNKNFLQDAFQPYTKLRNKGFSAGEIEQALLMYNEEHKFREKEKTLRPSSTFPRLSKWLDMSEAGYVMFYLEKVQQLNEKIREDTKEELSEEELRRLFREENKDFDDLMYECDVLQCKLIPLKLLACNVEGKDEMVMSIEANLRFKYDLFEKAFSEWCSTRKINVSNDEVVPEYYI